MTTSQAEGFAEFARIVEEDCGLRLEGKEYLLPSRLLRLAEELGLASLDELLTKACRRDPIVLPRAVEAMTTNETFFFREAHVFAALGSSVLPELVARSDGALTIWSAAASSGQEAYSLAILLREQLPAELANRCRILATDLSPSMVQRCREGAYSRFEITRGLDPTLASRYFTTDGQQWTAKPELRSMVRATTLNLLGSSWPDVGRCDLVLLRNVLVYFSDEVKERLVRRIGERVLTKDGYLLLGAGETLMRLDTGFRPQRVEAATFYRPEGLGR